MCLLFVLWLALRRSTRKVSRLLNPKGWTSRRRRTCHSDRPPGRPCRESPGLFFISLSHSLECDGSGLSIPAGASASLNSSAVGESAHSGGPWNFYIVSSRGEPMNSTAQGSADHPELALSFLDQKTTMQIGRGGSISVLMIVNPSIVLPAGNPQPQNERRPSKPLEPPLDLTMLKANWKPLPRTQ